LLQYLPKRIMHFLYHGKRGAGELLRLGSSQPRVFLNGRAVRFNDHTITDRLLNATTVCERMASSGNPQSCTEFALHMSGVVLEPYSPNKDRVHLRAEIAENVVKEIDGTDRLLVLGDGAETEDRGFWWSHMVVPASTDRGEMVLHKLNHGGICLSGVQQALDMYSMSEIREVSSIDVVSIEDERTLATYR